MKAHHTQRRHWQLVPLVVALVLGITLVLPTHAATEAFTISETIPLAIATENPCTGELVTLNGTYHFTSNYRVTADESGTKFHSVESKKLSLSGTAVPNGARYQNEQHELTEENGQFTFDAGSLAPYERTDVTTMLLIRQGEITRQDDFYVKFTSHVTYNANGVVTVSGGELDVVCR